MHPLGGVLEESRGSRNGYTTMKFRASPLICATIFTVIVLALLTGAVTYGSHASVQLLSHGPMPPPDDDTSSFMAHGPMPPPDDDTSSFMAHGPMPPPDDDTTGRIA